MQQELGDNAARRPTSSFPPLLFCPHRLTPRECVRADASPACVRWRRGRTKDRLFTAFRQPSRWRITHACVRRRVDPTRQRNTWALLTLHAGRLHTGLIVRRRAHENFGRAVVASLRIAVAVLLGPHRRLGKVANLEGANLGEGDAPWAQTWTHGGFSAAFPAQPGAHAAAYLLVKRQVDKERPWLEVSMNDAR